MNTKVELWVNGTGQTNQGQLDLYSDEPITINMANSDIKDIKVRKTNFTQSFVIPGTKNNNQIFNSIFNIGADCYFDPRHKTPAYLLVDSIPVMQKGTMQLTGIAMDEKKNIDYEISIFDESIDLIDSIGDDYLTDINYSGLNHVWNYSNITSSWTGNTFNGAVYYPLIDYGYDFNISQMNVGSGVNINQLIPSTQVKYYWDAIFSAAGFSYESTFLSGSYFTNLYVPYNSSAILTQDSGFTISRSFQAGGTYQSGFTVHVPTGLTSSYFFPIMNVRIPCSNDSPLPNFDNGNLYIASSSTYSSDTISNQIFNVILDFIYSATTATTVGGVGGPRNTVNFYRTSASGGTFASPTYFAFETPSDWFTVTPGVRTQKLYSTLPLDGSSLYHNPLEPGEQVWFTVSSSFQATTFVTGQTASFNIYSAGTFFFNTVSTQALPGQPLNYNNFIPQKIKQIDFVNSIIQMHNLYVTPVKNKTKTLRIEPRDTYYSGGTTKDWSKKLDASVKYKEQLISEQQNKRIIFTYKKDVDYYNSDYSLKTNKIFGDYYFNIDNDFVKDDKTIDVIFSPTPSVAVLESSTSTTNYANEFVIPKIGKRDNSNNFGKTDSNIRILQKNNAGLVNLQTGDYWLLNGVQQTKYPYLGMLDHPGTGTTDISFGTVDYEYYTLSSITSNNLVNAYWQQYLQQISDKDSKLVTANFYLTPEDIQSFDFSDSIFVDGISDDGGHYYIVNSITYAATDNATSQVELIKVKNKFVDTTTRSNIISTAARDTFQSIALAGASTVSTGSIAVGKGVSIGFGSIGSIAVGTDNVVQGGSPRSFIVGSGNTVPSGVQSAIILGDNITAISGGTLYTNSIVLSSGSTINGTPISAITSSITGTSASLWSASTGTNSIIANNGTGNNVQGNYSIASGFNNKSTYNYSVIGGGINNINHSQFGVITGGRLNFTYGQGAFIGAGNSNSATTTYSSIIGGVSNLASGYYSIVVNGLQNLSSGLFSLIGNGRNNYSNGQYSTVLGGFKNSATTVNSIVLGGKYNLSSYFYSSVINGKNNISDGNYSFIANGNINTSYGNYSFIGNGRQHIVNGIKASVLNGVGNSASTTYSTVLGGRDNISSGLYSLIGNGGNNKVTSNFSLIDNGYQNSISANYSSIVGGQYNSITGGGGGFIGTGFHIKLSGPRTFVGNGSSNSATTNYSTILNGKNSSANGVYGTVINGLNNHATGLGTTIIAGSGINSSLVNTAVAQNFGVVTGGTSASAGVVTLVAGSAVIATNLVKADSMIFLSIQSLGTVAVATPVAVTATNPSLNFTITSASITDTSVIAWWIIQPAQ